MNTSILPAALAATLLFVAGCGDRKDAPDPGDLEIGIIDEDALPEAFDEVAPAEPSACGSVRAQLREKGIRPGYDEERGLLVVVANADAPCQNPRSDKRFADLRTECMDLALKNARRQFLEFTSMNLTVENSDGPDIAKDNGASATETFVRCADGVISGASVIVSAESWWKGEYEIAVAAVVSEKLTSDITDRIAGKTAENGKPGKWSLREWIDAQDFSLMLGPRSFVDDTGVRRYLGVGAADAEAATGAALKMAQAKAQVEATKYAFFSFPTRIHSKMMFRPGDSDPSDDGNFDEEYTENPEAVPQDVRVILQTDVVHPLSGRKMAVVVVEAIP